MNAFPQTWYRPNDYGNELLEELTVVGETPQMIAVESQDYKGKKSVRKQYKSGACRSKREAFELMLESAKRSEQYAKDALSKKIQRRKKIECALAAEQAS
jgi:hypothetical protein